MNRFRTLEILDPFTSFYDRTSIYAPKSLPFPSFLEEEEEDLSFALDFLHPDPLYVFETASDLIRVDPRARILKGICERVNALEERFDRVLKGEERKYTWTAEINGPVVERKYTWVAEMDGGKKKKKKEVCKWTAEIKGKEGREGSRKYSFQVSSEGDKKNKKEEEEVRKKKKENVGLAKARIVEIEEPRVDHGACVLRQAYAKRAGALKAGKGKRKELCPQDAALMIQMTFRAYLIRRSQALRALRELAIAKSKLKELRGLFNNFSYRRLVARDGEERQKFSEKIIVLLLTVDAINGADLMVRSAKRSMVDELEAMLDVVDPQPPQKLLSMKRRTFDMPDGVIRKEIAEGVAQVVQMLDDENA